MQAMYFHYVMHNLKPSEWYAMRPGERCILRAFMMQELETEHKQIQEIEKECKKVMKDA